MTAPRVSWIAILLGGLAIAGSAILAFVGMGRMGMLILLGGLGIAGCVLLGRAAYRSGAQGPATDLNEDVEVRRAR